MDESSFAPKSVMKFLDGQHRFWIPSYQRGYRWEKKQVIDLLDDIWQFSKADDGNDSYYLQPLVVKACLNREQKTAWEVLDGQQRLTTLLLILKYMVPNCLVPLEKEKFENKLYTLEYENRPQLDFGAPDADGSPDGYYLSEAKKHVKAWFEKKTESGYDISRFKSCLFNANKRQVKFIWYEVEKKSQVLDSIQVFNRLNKGKISLTSSELIKALFIMDEEIIAKNQNRPSNEGNYISLRWHEMERRFQDDSFWYFLSNGTYQTRIDVLFDFLTCRPPDTDDDYSYRMFQNLYDFCRAEEHNLGTGTRAKIWEDANISSLSEAWDKVEETFNRLEAWYEDNMHYHYVGFLVAMGNSPLSISNKLGAAKSAARRIEPSHEWTDEDTENAYQKMIMDNFKRGNRYLSKDDIDELEYGSEYIMKLLLLFNVQTCRINGRQRFDFSGYKQGRWDVEHIDSQNEHTLQKTEERLEWMKNVEFILDIEAQSVASRKEQALALRTECSKLREIFEQADRIDLNKYKKFYTKVQQYFTYEGTSDGDSYEKLDLSTKNKNGLGNLTLLDSGINRSYKDAPFPYKRYRIIKEDKSGENFMPVCTRNVFLKYYSDSRCNSSFIDMLRWNSQDQMDYMHAIHQVVDQIFDSVNTDAGEA